ncbi:DUF2304 domain-containing protein [Patescibacteria group bacterium]|nr:DUF2304 domain-containing protein [Patescibacteria group bacterium]MBU1868429.1 DUF2304 domain-containing protein [Patescibacteria group bacterium]
MILKILISVFTVIVLSQVYSNFRQRKLNFFWFIFWCSVWISVEAVALYPKLTVSFAKLLNIEFGINAVVSFSVITLFYLVFYLYLKIEEQKRKMSEYIRKQAIRENIKQNK